MIGSRGGLVMTSSARSAFLSSRTRSVLARWTHSAFVRLRPRDTPGVAINALGSRRVGTARDLFLPGAAEAVRDVVAGDLRRGAGAGGTGPTQGLRARAGSESVGGTRVARAGEAEPVDEFVVRQVTVVADAVSH